MYAWGADTGDWRGKASYDYGSARAKYDKNAADAGVLGKSRSYTLKRTPNMKLVDPKGKTISSNSENPIILGIDGTGSMDIWTGEISDRLPLMYQTLGKYRPDAEFAFAVIGDATSDTYPLQISNFSKDIKELEENLKAFGPEGNGGGHITESYELLGHFLLNHCHTPNAKSPFLLIYGDEGFYDKIDPNQVKHYIGDDLESPLESKVMWASLMQKFNLYYMQKPYGASGDPTTTKMVKDIWTKAIAPQRIIELPFAVDMEDGKGMPGYQRAVDMGMGLIAKTWGEYKDFGKSIAARHDDPSIKKSIDKSLRFIDADPIATSVTSKPTGSKATKSLA